MDLLQVETLVAILALFIGSTMFSAIGFGIGMVATPVLLLVLDPQTVIVVVTACGAGIGIWIVVQARKDIPFREILPIAIAGALGVPFAVYVLKFADPGIMRIGISVLVLMLAATATFNFQREFPYSKVVGVLAGLAVEVVLPAFGVGGPLVTLYLLTRNWQRESVRAAMAFYLLVLDVFSVAGYAVARLYTAERLILIALMVIPMLAGLGLGALILKLMSERVFRYAVLTIIISSSISVLIRAVASI